MSRIRNTIDMKNKIKELVNDEYSLISEYFNTKTKVLIKHNICGIEYMVTPHDFCSRGRRCPNCFGKNKRTTDQWQSEVDSLSNYEYEVLDEYSNNRTKLKMLHRACDSIVEISPSNFKKGHRCKFCSARSNADNMRLPKGFIIKCLLMNTS